MPATAWTLRMAAFMGAGTFAVHQLRFALAPPHGGDPAAVAAHSYLVTLAPVVAALLLIAFAAALGRIVRGQHDPLPRLKRLWGGATASLIAVYCAQETIEAALTGAHGGWTSAALGDGGWVALPLALIVGLAIAGLSRGAAAATRRTARRPLTAIAIKPAATAVLPPWAPHPTDAPSRNLAARGPPLPSV